MIPDNPTEADVYDIIKDFDWVSYIGDFVDQPQHEFYPRAMWIIQHVIMPIWQAEHKIQHPTKEIYYPPYHRMREIVLEVTAR